MVSWPGDVQSTERDKSGRLPSGDGLLIADSNGTLPALILTRRILEVDKVEPFTR